MHFNATSLPDVYTIDLTPFRDHRGVFTRVFCQEEFAEAGLKTGFVQINQSLTHLKGTIRGLHYQMPPHAEVKLVRCINGAIYDVVVDLRMGSPTFMQHFGIELSSESQKMIYIPEGFAHGFQTLTDDASLIYQHSTFYWPAAERGIRYNEPRLNISWPLDVTDISEKDKNHIFMDRLFEGVNIL